MAEDSGGVSGIGIAAVFAGGILVWSGVKGYSVSGVFRDLISGKQPSNLQQTTPVHSSGLFGGLVTSLLSAQGGSGSPGSATMIGQSSGSGWSSQDRMTFAKSLLATINAPQTQANINSILGWINHEGGGGKNNPLNTTLPMSGSTNFNDLGGGQGVQNYPSLAIGVLANARTLMGGNYSEIVSALRSGQGLCGRSFAGLSTWSGGGYSQVC
jgi:hypothetical protein